MQRVINRDGPALPGGNNRSTPILSDRYQDSFPSEAGEIYILGFFFPVGCRWGSRLDRNIQVGNRANAGKRRIGSWGKAYIQMSWRGIVPVWFFLFRKMPFETRGKGASTRFHL